VRGRPACVAGGAREEDDERDGDRRARHGVHSFTVARSGLSGDGGSGFERFRPLVVGAGARGAEEAECDGSPVGAQMGSADVPSQFVEVEGRWAGLGVLDLGVGGATCARW
jgi:hypothetical protein